MELPLISGVDLSLGVRRTGGCVPLYLRFLKRYPRDDTFMQLGCALQEGRMKEAFCHAHTLKGLSDQLGIFIISVPSATLCELLRPCSPHTLSTARNLYEEMLPVHNKLVQDIRALT